MRARGTGTINSSGYIEVRVKGQRQKKFMHRLVWEQHNGQIPDGWHVHHINGDKLDNRIENLMVIDEPTHHKIHAGYKFVDGKWWKRCNVCGEFKQLYVDFTIKGNKTNAYRCKDCMNAYLREYNLKNKEKAKAAKKKYYLENRDECLKYYKQYHFNRKLKTGIVNANLLHSYLSVINNSMEGYKPCQITA